MSDAVKSQSVLDDLEDHVSTIQYPSSAFPLHPQVQLSIPEAWEALNVPGSLLTVKYDRGNELFSPNVILTILRDAPDVSLADAAKGIKAYIDSLNTVAFSEHSVKLGGRDWYVVEFGRTIDGVGDIIQIVATTPMKNDPVVDVIRLTGSAAAEDHQDGLKAVREIIASARVSLQTTS
jgi:hypothetical protein